MLITKLTDYTPNGFKTIYPVVPYDNVQGLNKLGEIVIIEKNTSGVNLKIDGGWSDTHNVIINVPTEKYIKYIALEPQIEGVDSVYKQYAVNSVDYISVENMAYNQGSGNWTITLKLHFNRRPCVNVPYRFICYT